MSTNHDGVQTDDEEEAKKNMVTTTDSMQTMTATSTSMVSKRASCMASFKVMDILQRANELQNVYQHDVLHCEVGQPETGAPYPVVQAATMALNNTTVSSSTSTLGYTDSFGLLELRTKIQQHYKKKYHLQPSNNHEISNNNENNDCNDIVHNNNNNNNDVGNGIGMVPSVDQIVITTGSSGAFLLAFHACFDVLDVVAIASVGYPCYRNILEAVGCTIVHIPVNTEFKLTAIELKQMIQDRKEQKLPPIKGLILSSPSNPTGSMLSPNELQELCQVTDEHSIQFISDEIYHGITYGKPVATAIQYSKQVIVINSFSKYYSMSGWRLGWMIIPETLIQPITSLQQNMFINAPTISQVAAYKCWDNETNIILEQHVEKYKCSRSIILNAIEELTPPILLHNIAPADGGFYIYIDLSMDYICLPKYGAVTFCQSFLEEYYVAITPGIDFEDPTTLLGQRRIRISYSQGIHVITDAMKRFHTFWPTWIERVQKEKKQQQENCITTNGEGEGE